MISGLLVPDSIRSRERSFLLWKYKKKPREGKVKEQTDVQTHSRPALKKNKKSFRLHICISSNMEGSSRFVYMYPLWFLRHNLQVIGFGTVVWLVFTRERRTNGNAPLSFPLSYVYTLEAYSRDSKGLVKKIVDSSIRRCLPSLLSTVTFAFKFFFYGCVYTYCSPHQPFSSLRIDCMIL